ncbi:MAG TPA: type VI secretion system tip protein TssI/VgrG [Sandaracinaceae bacterium LLY-WYZ-13_1]|nr:type VI secretion system tip protein TssI/VgrG [Sandaracinaceae bacterium LLY-WYZ-13_1]
MAAEDDVIFTFRSEPLAGVETDLSDLRVGEALSEPYRLDAEVAITDPDVDISVMLGKDAEISVRHRGHERTFLGVVRRVEEGRHGPDGVAANVVVVPALWMLGLRRNTRMFQEQSVPDILEAVLGEALGPYGREVSFELDADYPRREYCLQYQETDLDFVHRLMEEEGIHYSFDHTGAVELMVLRDANESFPEIAVEQGALVSYLPHDLESMGEQAIQQFRLRHTTTTTSAVVRDWDWTRGGDMTVQAEERSSDAKGRDRESYEHGEGRSLTLWDYAPSRYAASDETRQARLRVEAHVHDQLTGAGLGRVLELAPGTVFELTGHPNVGADGRYVVTRVEHRSAPLSDVISGMTSRSTYHNRFECIPYDTPFRIPRRTAKPRIPGVQTAVVTGPAGEEIHTDEHGRIKVQFHWDREGSYDENSSCWIRVQQPWAGNGWGFWYLPRIDMEVVVRFIDGDPDRPLVTGCVYNASNPTPYALPDEKTKSTIKSNSSPGGGGFNELRFEDKKGEEEIYAHAQKDYNEVVENDHTTYVKHDQSNTVDNDQTQTIGNDQTETVHNDQSVTVDANRTVHVKSDFEEQIDGTETRNVSGDVTETFSSNETREIAANVTESIGANETRTISGNQEESVSGDHTRTVSGASTVTVSGSSTRSVSGGITESTQAAYTISAVGGYNITSQASVTLTATGGMVVAAPGGIQKVDSFLKWEGATKNGSGVFDLGYNYVKDEFAGLVMGITGYKCELGSFNAAQSLSTVYTVGLAFFSPITEVINGGCGVYQGPTSDA